MTIKYHTVHTVSTVALMHATRGQYIVVLTVENLSPLTGTQVYNTYEYKNKKCQTAKSLLFLIVTEQPVSCEGKFFGA